MTKDRIGGVLVAIAAVIGLVLVFNGRDAPGGDDDDGPNVGTTGGTSTSQVQSPAPGRPGVSPAQPGQPAAPGAGPAQPGQPAAPAAPPKKDDDGDDD